MTHRITRKLSHLAGDQGRMEGGLRRLEGTVKVDDKLCAHQKCSCLVCHSSHMAKLPKPIQLPFDSELAEPQKWMQKILEGLCPQGMPTIKLFVPDICFVDGDILSVFSTDSLHNRITKDAGSTPIKMLFPVMLRMRKAYKQLLEQTFHRSMLDKIDPNFIHEKYIKQMLPTHFHNGEESQRLMENRSCFKKYVLHKLPEYVVDSIEEHKLNQNQPFCGVRFKDSTLQLFTQPQFQSFTIMKIPNDILYIQAYIKQKQQTKGIYTSEFTASRGPVEPDLFYRAQTQILVLIGGLGKYSERYEDLDVLEDTAHDLMLNNPERYVHYATYRIIHYLSMVSRIYVKHIKINWIINDIGFLYLQNVFQFQTSDLPLIPLKFRLPPREHDPSLYKDAQKFTLLYKQMMKSKYQKAEKFRSELKSDLPMLKESDDSTNYTTISAAKPQQRRTMFRRQPPTKINKTIDVVGRVQLKKPKLLNMQLLSSGRTIDRHSINGRATKNLPSFQKGSRYRNQTSLDKYNF